MSTQEGHDFAKRHGCLFVETSAKTNVAVGQAFEELLLKVCVLSCGCVAVRALVAFQAGALALVCAEITVMMCLCALDEPFVDLEHLTSHHTCTLLWLKVSTVPITCYPARSVITSCSARARHHNHILPCHGPTSCRESRSQQRPSPMAAA